MDGVAGRVRPRHADEADEADGGSGGSDDAASTSASASAAAVDALPLAEVPRPCYDGVNVLAPMVRCCTLPLRLQALEHGADLVWSEELIAVKIARCKRVPNADTRRVEYWAAGDSHAIYVTEPGVERGRNILQLGAADGASAVAAGRVIADDVAGFDVNMGCPKRFSTQGAMGSALLRDPERAADIVRSLARNFGAARGVTCKIRIVESAAGTEHFVRAMIAAGAAAVTVHARTREERPTDYAHWDVVRHLVSCRLPVPIIANGDVFTADDAAAVRAATGVTSVMLARGALANPSVFAALRGRPTLPATAAVQQYIAIARRVHNITPNTKYTVQTMVKEAGHVSEDAMFAARTDDDLTAWAASWVARDAAGALKPPSSRLRSAHAAGVEAPFVPKPPYVPRAAAGGGSSDEVAGGGGAAKRPRRDDDDGGE